MESFLCLKVSLILLLLVHCVLVHGDCIHDVQPLSKIAIHRALFAIHVNASLRAEPVLLGTKVTQIVFLFTFFLLCCFLSWLWWYSGKEFWVISSQLDWFFKFQLFVCLRKDWEPRIFFSTDLTKEHLLSLSSLSLDSRINFKGKRLFL